VRASSIPHFKLRVCSIFHFTLHIIIYGYKYTDAPNRQLRSREPANDDTRGASTAAQLCGMRWGADWR
jgi:hypothetical protein